MHAIGQFGKVEYAASSEKQSCGRFRKSSGSAPGARPLLRMLLPRLSFFAAFGPMGTPEMIIVGTMIAIPICVVILIKRRSRK